MLTLPLLNEAKVIKTWQKSLLEVESLNRIIVTFTIYYY